MKFNKKTIIICALTLLVIFSLIISTSIFIKQKKIAQSQDNYKNIGEIAVEYELLTINQINSCEAVDFCTEYIIETSLQNLKKRGKVFNIDIEVNGKVEEFKNLYKKREFKNLSENYKTFITQCIDRINKKNNSSLNYKEVKEIISLNTDFIFGSGDYKIGYFLQEGDFILINIIPAGELTDPANIILKKNGLKWESIYGPGTYFEETELQKLNVPKTIISKMKIINIGAEEPVVYPKQDTSTIPDNLE